MSETETETEYRQEPASDDQVAEVEEDMLVEEISIDGMCGVY
ncbi:mycofactocin precursor MftA [Streptomyces sp. AC512_CC834]|nr:mycofactocin precursor MftA [Streptomyces sp. AC512_CC834]